MPSRWPARAVVALALGMTPALAPESIRAQGSGRIALLPTERAPGASGIVALVPARSPFAMAVAADGRLVYDLALEVRGLADPAVHGGATTYVAWVATSGLEQVDRIGALGADGRAAGRTALNKFIVLITAERARAPERRSGPVVLRGVSPSSLLQSFRGHAFFERDP